MVQSGCVASTKPSIQDEKNMKTAVFASLGAGLVGHTLLSYGAVVRALRREAVDDAIDEIGPQQNKHTAKIVGTILTMYQVPAF